MFAENTTTYTATVANDVTSVIVTPVAANAKANVKVNGGQAPATIELVVGFKSNYSCRDISR